VREKSGIHSHSPLLTKETLLGLSSSKVHSFSPQPSPGSAKVQQSPLSIFLFFISLLLLYWGYIVTFTNVLTTYHS
jgi:hypothetical protein